MECLGDAQSEDVSTQLTFPNQRPNPTGAAEIIVLFTVANAKRRGVGRRGLPRVNVLAIGIRGGGVPERLEPPLVSILENNVPEKGQQRVNSIDGCSEAYRA